MLKISKKTNFVKFNRLETFLKEGKFYLLGEPSDIKFWMVPTLRDVIKYYLTDSGKGWIHHLIRRTDR